MVNLTAILAAIFASGVGGFHAACHIVSIWTGCGPEEAAKKVRDFINGKSSVPLEEDPGFYNEICQSLQNVVGEKRYNELAKLDAALRVAGQAPVIACGSHSGVPYFAVSVPPKDDTEKQVIETVLVGLTKKHLVARGLGTEVLSDWGERMDINSPYLEIRYPNNAQDRKLIVDTIARDGFAVVDANRPLTDDTEEDDLTDG